MTRTEADRPAWDVDLVNIATQAELLADLSARMAAGQGFTVATLNLDHLVKLRRIPEFATAYADHSHVVADGNPVVWLQRIAGRHVALVPGSELISPLAAIAANLNIPVAFLGSTDATLTRAAAKLRDSHPGLQIVAQVAPPIGLNPGSPAVDPFLEHIKTSGAGLCFLALGAPRQEVLAIRAARHAPNCGFVSIGAGLDFLAGHQKRAPRWVQQLALEWVWRVILSPRRLAKRYLDCILIMPGLTMAALKQRSVRKR